jgi:hypothetical protein
VPNMVDHNVLWDVRGTAISAGDTDNLVVAHNLIGPTARVGVRAAVLTDRTLDGRAMTARGNRVLANLILAEQPVSFEDDANESAYNVFGRPGFDLAAWQRTGRDAHGRAIVLRGAYDVRSGELRLQADEPLPVIPVRAGADVDFFGPVSASSPIVPGPFAERFTGEVVLDVSPVGRLP